MPARSSLSLPASLLSIPVSIFSSCHRRCKSDHKYHQDSSQEDVYPVSLFTLPVSLFLLVVSLFSSCHRRFKFDHVYDQDSSQEDVYLNTAQQVVLQILQGYNAAIIAYGQVRASGPLSWWFWEGGVPGGRGCSRSCWAKRCHRLWTGMCKWPPPYCHGGLGDGLEGYQGYAGHRQIVLDEGETVVLSLGHGFTVS